MKASELRTKSVAELRQQLQQLYQDQFNLRMQNSTDRLGQVHLIGEARKDIARIKTIITEKQQAEKQQQPAQLQQTVQQPQPEQPTEQQQAEQL